MTTRDPLGDMISSVGLVDYLGSDLSVVNAARVSMAKESRWDIDEVIDVGFPNYRERHLSDKDKGLIRYLATHNHWTPFSHPQITLRIKMPIFIARQWFKHQVGFTRNETSRRYVDSVPELYIPTLWRKRAERVKQGSSDTAVDNSHQIEWNVKAAAHRAIQLYDDLLTDGVCPEQARMVLPQSMYTEFIETGSLAAYARLCKLRLDPHAQQEVRWYAEEVAEIIKPLFATSWEALCPSE
jgi:thymidylate synthase (FAD)